MCSFLGGSFANVAILLFFFFHDLSQAGSLGSPSVAFSEQEEGGTNDRYRNEVATGPLVGGGEWGLRWSCMALAERSAVTVLWREALTLFVLVWMAWPQPCWTGHSFTCSYLTCIYLFMRAFAELGASVYVTFSLFTEFEIIICDETH